MKTAAITLRLSSELARHLVRLARGRGVPKSQLVREAVARYIEPPVTESRAPLLTARSLADRWKHMPGLTPDEASAFRDDVESARKELPAIAPEWE